MPTVKNWNQLNLNHVEKAVIHQDTCIQCGRCHVVCEDTSHQAIWMKPGPPELALRASSPPEGVSAARERPSAASADGRRHFEVNEAECVGCNLCVSICPVPGTITMRALQPGETDLRTGRVVDGSYANWTTHPNNPMRTGCA